jgi:pyruvate formate lyase activating enzyme
METAAKSHTKASQGDTGEVFPDRTGRRGLVFNIQRFSLHDGPGIRTTVFLKGCPLSCSWCHNPEGLLPECELSRREITLDGQTFRDDETVGRWMTVEEVLSELRKESVFHEESGGGVTISGGEPLMQPEFLRQLLLASGNEGLHRTLDTCGYAGRSVVESIADHVELFLFDLKIMDEAQHREHTGASNKPILENLKVLVGRKKDVVIRFPVVPGITDTKQNVIALKELMHGLSLSRIDLLPYHTLASQKYRKLERPNPAPGLAAPTDERVQELRQDFEQNGLEVRIGG